MKPGTLVIMTVLVSIILIGIGDSMDLKNRRDSMVDEQILARGVRDPRVLAAMRKVERHLFVPERAQPQAYEDRPLSIGEGQTISQPYIVAFMTEAAGVTKDSKVLEVGTGSGYQAAVLSELAGEVYTVEIIRELADSARERLARLGYANVHVRQGDGYQGWPEEAPFDAIVVTAAPPEVPQALVDQLKEGGRLVVPVGVAFQDLLLITRREGKIETRNLIPVMFVPMVHDRDPH